MKLSKLFILILCCACAPAWAQRNVSYTDKVLFDAYLKTDMKVWDQYLHAVSFDQLSASEKQRYLNYEYGYVATAIDEKAPDAKQHLKDFETHINALSSTLPKATVLTYRSSCSAYQALMNKMQFISKGLESFNTIKEAYEVDSLNPLVLALKGNVDFYAPKAFGGNKQRALQYFRTTCRLYEAKGDTLTNWNYVSIRLCIIQCEDKLGNTKLALRLARELLRDYPGFCYLRDEYLPDLERREKKK